MSKTMNKSSKTMNKSMSEINDIINSMSEINDIKQIIIIQKYVRGYLSRKQILIPQSYYQTKIWRKNRTWYINGKSNECEKYQIKLIEKIIITKLLKTHDRINMETNEIINKKNPMVNDDGYEWSENFDGKLIKNNNIYYYNLKFVCESGGAQTRTLRELYHFIKHQMECLIQMVSNLNEFPTINSKNFQNNIYFINILDGAAIYNNMHKFKFLINKEKYKHVLKYVFIGSLYDFQKEKINYK